MARTRSGLGLAGRRVTRSVSATQPAEPIQTAGGHGHEGQMVGLRGGSSPSDEESDDDDYHDPDQDSSGLGRKRSRSRARKVIVRPHVPGLNKEPDYIPPTYAYQAIAKEVTHEAKMRLLGIDESLLEPLADDDVVTRWFGRRRSLSELSEYGVADDLLRKLVEASGLRRKWKPTQMRFKNPWPEDEIEDDDWYKYLFQDLDIRVTKFANTHFGEVGGMGDVETAGDRLTSYVSLPKAWQAWVCDFVDHAYSLWLRGTTKQFCYYASLVAKNDNKCASWERMLASGLHRPLLVRGVIMKVLQTSVFDKLLFGADKMAEEMLDAHDELTIRMDGYKRTDLRSQLVRSALHGNTLPVFFWPHVDALTTRLTTLLLPTVELMDANFAASRARSLRKLYQDLHHIVAEAGYFSVAIRQSRTVFRWLTTTPGQVWDHDQSNAAVEVYELSKEAAAEQDRLTKQEWLKEQKKERERRKKSGSGDAAAQTMPAYHEPFRMGYVHIVMAPALFRYVPHEDIRKPEGHTKTAVAFAQVCYYQGFADLQEEDAQSYPNLAEYLSDCRWRAWATPQRWVRAAWAWRHVLSTSLAVVALLFAINATRFGADQAKETIRAMLAELHEGLVKQPVRAYQEPWHHEDRAFLAKLAGSLSAFAWTCFTSFLGALNLLFAVLMKPFSK